MLPVPFKIMVLIVWHFILLQIHFMIEDNNALIQIWLEIRKFYSNSKLL